LSGQRRLLLLERLVLFAQSGGLADFKDSRSGGGNDRGRDDGFLE
jgi:hypothetical protein